ncbi:MAG: hypothetical protein KatS3mg087_1411 [Patescibacteria group bacterium]|nr:MAG: hypothetical protein KatS3mg087_1411 [Patescibacteria group bacterium]
MRSKRLYVLFNGPDIVAIRERLDQVMADLVHVNSYKASVDLYDSGLKENLFYTSLVDRWFPDSFLWDEYGRISGPYHSPEEIEGKTGAVCFENRIYKLLPGESFYIPSEHTSFLYIHRDQNGLIYYDTENPSENWIDLIPIKDYQC